MAPTPPLPIDPHLPEILDRLRSERRLVLVAPPGAGKTTRLAPSIVRDRAGASAGAGACKPLLSPRSPP